MHEQSKTKMHTVGPCVAKREDAHHWCIYDASGMLVARRLTEANAARLELCWNSHDAMVEALREEVAFFDKLQSDNPGDPLNEMRERVHGKRIAKARSALKLAQGGPK